MSHLCDAFCATATSAITAIPIALKRQFSLSTLSKAVRVLHWGEICYLSVMHSESGMDAGPVMQEVGSLREPGVRIVHSALLLREGPSFSNSALIV